MSLITIDTSCPRSSRWTYASVPILPGPAVRVVAANPARRKVILQNTSGIASVNIGPDSSVGPTYGVGGFPINHYAVGAPPDGLPSRIELETTAEIWAVSSGANLQVIELLD